MPLPNPDYLTDEFFGWDATEESSVVFETNGTTLELVLWNYMDFITKSRLHDLIMGYADKNSVAEVAALTGYFSTSGFQVLDFGGTAVAGNSTGLHPTDGVTGKITIDGADFFVTTDGTASPTFADLIVNINAVIAGFGLASIVNGNLMIESLGVDTNNTFVDVSSGLLWLRLTGFVSFGSQFHGSDTALRILYQNKLDNSFVDFVTLLHGARHSVPEKPPGVPGNTSDFDHIYFNHATSTWRRRYNDAAV